MLMPPDPVTQGRETLGGERQRVHVHTAGESRSEVEGPGLSLSVSKFVLLSCSAVHPHRQECRTFSTISDEQATPGRITSAYSRELLDSTSGSSGSAGKPCPVGSLRRAHKTEPSRQVARAASTKFYTR